MEEGWESDLLMKSFTDPPKEPPPRLPKSLMHIHRPEPSTASQTPCTPATRTIRRCPPPPIPPRNKIGKSELANPRNMEEMIQRVSDVRRLLEKRTGLIEVMLERQKTLDQNMKRLLDLIDKQPQGSYPVKEDDNFHGSGPEKQALTSYIVPTDKSGGNVQTPKLVLKLYLRQVSKLICKTTVIMTAELKILAILKMVTLLKKHRKNCESCQTQATWNVKFRCQFCPFLSCPVLSCPEMQDAKKP